MSRFSTLAAALFCLALAGATGACDGTSSEHKINGAHQDGAGQNLTELQEAQQKTAEAKAETTRRAAESQADLVRQRQEYKATTDQSLAALDQQIHRLDIQAKHAPGKARTDLEDKVKKIQDLRATFADDYTEVDTTTVGAWDETQVRLNGELADLQHLVAAATPTE